jgi:4-hydroxymandelate oxidase
MKINLNDFEDCARKDLESSIFDFFYGGAGDEITLKENVEAYNRIKLIPRVLTGIIQPNTSVSILGQSVSCPILIAPMAFQKLCHPLGELETARASKQANILMVSSLYTTTPLKDLISEMLLSPWFQLYILKDRDLTRAIIEVADFLGCNALVLTVDAPFYSKRERELRNPIKKNILLPDLLAICEQLGYKKKLSSATDLSAFLEPSLSWSDIEWIRSITKMPIILKGILRPDDALLALNHGVSGIIVSNHGGRQLDTAVTPIEALPSIAKAINKKMDIYIDSGIRRGVDILKALALGASAVLVGRPILWGLANDGASGVYNIISLLQEELKLTMALCGAKNISEISPALIFNEFLNREFSNEKF